MQCPICEVSIGEPPQLCRCGYDVSKNEVIGTEALKSFYRNLKTNSHWAEHIKFINRLHEFQKSKKGETSTGRRGGWRYKDTARLLGIEPSVVSDDLKLAAYFEEYPELKIKKYRQQALDTIPNLKSGMISINFSVYDTEDNLQKYLENNWHETPLSKNWELKESFSKAGDAGEIDLLAKHIAEKAWLIIELKRKEAPDKTVGQLLRYMGWFKKYRAAENEAVKGMIISGYPPDVNLLHSISGASGVDLLVYYRLGEKTFFMDKETALQIIEFERRPLSEQEQILKSQRADTKNGSATT